MLHGLIRWMAKVTARSKNHVEYGEIAAASVPNVVFGAAFGLLGISALSLLMICALGEKSWDIFRPLGIIAGAMFVVWLAALRIVEIYLDVKEETSETE